MADFTTAIYRDPLLDSNIEIVRLVVMFRLPCNVFFYCWRNSLEKNSFYYNLYINVSIFQGLFRNALLPLVLIKTDNLAIILNLAFTAKFEEYTNN